MTDTPQLLVVLSHPDTLASGRPIAPGDEIPPDALDPSDLHDAHLITSGALLARDSDGRPVDLPTELAAAAELTMRGTEERHAGEQAEWAISEDNPNASTGVRLGDAPTPVEPPQEPVVEVTASDTAAATGGTTPEEN